MSWGQYQNATIGGQVNPSTISIMHTRQQYLQERTNLSVQVKKEANKKYIQERIQALREMANMAIQTKKETIRDRITRERNTAEQVASELRKTHNLLFTCETPSVKLSMDWNVE